MAIHGVRARDSGDASAIWSRLPGLVKTGAAGALPAAVAGVGGGCGCVVNHGTVVKYLDTLQDRCRGFESCRVVLVRMRDCRGRRAGGAPACTCQA